MITVKDVWRGALPDGTELIAGGGGLDRRVEWATSLRTRPPAFEPIKGGELAFVPVSAIRLLDERLDLGQVIHTFADKGGVAVAILGAASREAIEVAERMMVPLLSLPAGVHLSDVQQQTVRFILDQRTLLHERQQDLHTQLMEVALAGAGMNAIIDRLASVTGRAAVWHDVDGRVQHAAATDGAALDLEEEFDRIRRWVAGVAVVASDPPVREFDIPASPGMARVIAPVPVRDGIGGFVSVIGRNAEMDQMTRLAVARAASACVIELDRERAVIQAKDDLEGEFLESLLAGTFSSEAAVRHRAERLGFDLGGEVLVLCVRQDTASDGLTRSRRDQLTLGAQGWSRRRAPGALATVRQGALAAIVPLGDQASRPDIRRLAADLRLECAGALGADDLSVGVGRPKPGIAGVRASYREAEQALTMGTRLFGGARVTAFADLGLHRLLFAMQGHAELREFYEDQVQRLVDYDRRTGAGLLRTLDAFFHCHGSPTEIAGILHLHRNTVLYRLRRIEDIGRLRLNDPETRLNLHLCLKVRDVLQAAGA